MLHQFTGINHALNKKLANEKIIVLKKGQLVERVKRHVFFTPISLVYRAVLENL